MFKVLAKSSLILHFDIRRGRQPWRTLELRRLKAQLGTCTTPPSRLAGGSSAARVAFITSPLQEKGDEISKIVFNRYQRLESREAVIERLVSDGASAEAVEKVKAGLR